MPKKKLNVVVFAVDSLRADHMDCYGYGRQTFPHVGRLVTTIVNYDGWSTDFRHHTSQEFGVGLISLKGPYATLT